MCVGLPYHEVKVSDHPCGAIGLNRAIEINLFSKFCFSALSTTIFAHRLVTFNKQNKKSMSFHGNVQLLVQARRSLQDRKKEKKKV